MKKKKTTKPPCDLRPPVPHNCITMQIRTDIRLIRNLYNFADRFFGGKVELVSDKMIRDYMDAHKDCNRLTTYLGYSTDYVYNIRMDYNTKMRLNKFCEKFECGVYLSEVVKASLYMWDISTRDNDKACERKGKG